MTAKQGKLVLKIGELLGKMSEEEKQRYISKVAVDWMYHLIVSRISQLNYSYVRCVQGVGNYWDNAVSAVNNRVPVSGQLGESKAQVPVSAFIDVAHE